MDEFVLPIDEQIFRSTNFAWNELMLNSPWSVGYVSTLIKLKEWKSKEDWEDFYYFSGKERLSLLGNDADLLNNYSYVRTNPNDVKALPYNIKRKNTQYGRTINELLQRAKTLHQYMQTQGGKITEEECFQCVRFRIICETWNGIILRENNTISTFERLFSHHKFIKTDGEKDHVYAVDYEMFDENVLVCGIQIKPESYMGDTTYIQKAKFANEQKYEKYATIYGVPVLTVISKKNGEICNTEVISKIKELINRKSKKTHVL